MRARWENVGGGVPAAFFEGLVRARKQKGGSEKEEKRGEERRWGGGGGPLPVSVCLESA